MHEISYHVLLHIDSTFDRRSGGLRTGSNAYAYACTADSNARVAHGHAHPTHSNARQVSTDAHR